MEGKKALKNMSGNGWEQAKNEQKWVKNEWKWQEVDGTEWKWVGVDGSKWESVRMGGSMVQRDKHECEWVGVS